MLGAYSVKDVEIPAGLTLQGKCSRPFNPATSADVLGEGSVILRATGGTAMFRWNKGITVDGLVMHGIDKTVECFRVPAALEVGGAQRVSRINIINCGLYGWSRGVGNFYYMQTCRIIGNQIAGNGMGVFGLVDCIVGNNFISFNDAQGVDQQNGANDTQFFGNKVEWNGAENFRFGNSRNCSIDGDIIDRSGTAGIGIYESQVRVNPSVIRRSGRTNVGATYCAHIHINGATSDVSIGPLLTFTGADDDATGSVTPSYGMTLEGVAAARVSMAGGSLKGAVTAGLLLNTVPVDCKLVGVSGVEDVVTTGLVQSRDGRRYFARSGSMNIAAGAVSAGLVVAAPPVNTFTGRSLKVRVESRNASNGTLIVAEGTLAVVREGGGASVYFVQAPYQATVNAGVVTPATTLLGATAGETLQLQFSAVAADASAFTVAVKNNHATATQQVMLTVLQ